MSSSGNKSIFAKNAVLFKDMSIDMKRPKILILMMIFNAIVFTTAGGFMIYVEAAGINGEVINYRALAIMLIVLIAEEAGILFAIVPALTANTISGERERQTLDVLLTTRMTPFEIVLGKYFSVLSLGIILILSSFPFLALVFIYGGLNFFQLLGLVAVLIYEVAYIAVFGVFFSALTKRTVPAVILSYISLGILLGGTFVAFGSLYAIGELINEWLHRTTMYGYTTTPGALTVPEIHFDWAIFLLYFNPGVTIFDCIGAFLGVEIDDVAFKGMKTIVDMSYVNGTNPLIVFWTPISLAIQGAISFGLLRLSGFCLNPVKNTKKRERAYERKTMKNIGVQPSFEEMGGIGMPPVNPEAAPAAQTVGQEGAVQPEAVPAQEAEPAPAEVPVQPAAPVQSEVPIQSVAPAEVPAQPVAPAAAPVQPVAPAVTPVQPTGQTEN